VLENKSRFVVDLQVESLSVLGNISQHVAEVRVGLRSLALLDESAQQAEVAKVILRNRAEVQRLLARYGDHLVSDGPPLQRVRRAEPRMG
jgi:hypothetical protein